MGSSGGVDENIYEVDSTTNTSCDGNRSLEATSQGSNRGSGISSGTGSRSNSTDGWYTPDCSDPEMQQNTKKSTNVAGNRDKKRKMKFNTFQSIEGRFNYYDKQFTRAFRVLDVLWEVVEQSIGKGLTNSDMNEYRSKSVQGQKGAFNSVDEKFKTYESQFGHMFNNIHVLGKLMRDNFGDVAGLSIEDCGKTGTEFCDSNVLEGEAMESIRALLDDLVSQVVAGEENSTFVCLRKHAIRSSKVSRYGESKQRSIAVQTYDAVDKKELLNKAPRTKKYCSIAVQTNNALEELFDNDSSKELLLIVNSQPILTVCDNGNYNANKTPPEDPNTGPTILSFGGSGDEMEPSVSNSNEATTQQQQVKTICVKKNEQIIETPEKIKSSSSETPKRSPEHLCKGVHVVLPRLRLEVLDGPANRPSPRKIPKKSSDSSADNDNDPPRSRNIAKRRLRFPSRNKSLTTTTNTSITTRSKTTLEAKETISSSETEVVSEKTDVLSEKSEVASEESTKLETILKLKEQKDQDRDKAEFSEPNMQDFGSLKTNDKRKSSRSVRKEVSISPQPQRSKRYHQRILAKAMPVDRSQIFSCVLCERAFKTKEYLVEHYYESHV